VMVRSLIRPSGPVIVLGSLIRPAGPVIVLRCQDGDESPNESIVTVEGVSVLSTRFESMI
jgi:hypothetical protein